MWFMNNGEPAFLTGLQMEHLVFNSYNSEKLDYYDDEINIFYFIDLTEKDNSCDGRVWIKPRRAKMTTIMCSLAQRKVLLEFSNYLRIQSDTQEKAIETYMAPIIDSYTNRESWMREVYHAPSGRKPVKNLRLSTSEIVQEQEDKPLGGKINVFATTSKSTDGLEAIESIMDEFSKWTESSPYETFEIIRKVIVTHRKRGKIDALSSTGDTKDAVNATMDWHKLIAKSDPLKKDEFGRTISGLWKYFISAIHSQNVPKEFTNKFGIVDKEKAEAWVWSEHKKYPEGTKERIFSMYKLPLKEEHALLSSATHSLFHKARISQRLTELEAMAEDEKPYVRGRLDETQSGRIIFVPDASGFWLFAVLPYMNQVKGIDTSNRYRIINGVYFPPVNPEGAIGYDPINFSKVQVRSNHYSQASATAHKKFDYFGSGIVDEKVALLLYRPDDPHDANKEIIKCCKFTGYLCMHECSVDHVYDDFKKANMLPFLLKVNDFYGMKTSPNSTKEGIVMLQSRYRFPQSPEEKDQILGHPFEDSLRSHDNFDPANTTAFDPTMSEIMLEHGLKQINVTNKFEDNHEDYLRRIQAIMPIRNK
ncbi:MAG: hypothetical protein NVS1B13_20940 [Flavisolibacter sp.]